MRNIRRYWESIRRYWAVKHDPITYARSLGVIIGDDCRLLNITPGTFGSEPYLVKLGNHVTITSGVVFSTHDGGVWVFRREYPNIDVFAPIIIGDNVFIGINTILLPGVKIGNNVVIGAGSIVTKDIPDNSVAVGAPARVLKSIEEYWESVQLNALFLREQTPDKKQEVLIRRFKDALLGKINAGISDT
jgi:acetyltransferase-like isoleucine patch superfamily enzyme